MCKRNESLAHASVSWCHREEVPALHTRPHYNPVKYRPVKLAAFAARSSGVPTPTPTTRPTLRPNVDQPVGGCDDAQVVLNLKNAVHTR